MPPHDCLCTYELFLFMERSCIYASWRWVGVLTVQQTMFTNICSD